jgi:hypothetical protein
MTKAEATDFGTERGTTRAEGVCLDTPWDGIAERLQKWKKRETWLSSADDDDWLKSRVPKAHWQAFKNAYAVPGVKFVKSYIKELKEDGLLKEMR